MNKRDVKRLKNGLYVIHWKGGGQSLAAVGCTGNGERWIAPINWIFPGVTSVWRKVESVEGISIIKTETMK